MTYTNAYLILLQVLVIITWLFKYRKLEKDIGKLERKGVVYTLALNAWLIVFLVQMLVGGIFVFSTSLLFLTVFGYISYTLGIILAIIGRLNLGISWGLPMQHNVKSQHELIRTGIYHYTRNPIYLSEMLMLLGFELVLHSWLVVLIVPFYLWNRYKALKEEAILKQVYKEEYVEYMTKTPRFL